MRRSALWLPLVVIMLALLVRGALLLLVHQPVVSDGLAYWTMATSALTERGMHDNFDQIAFYSAGYPWLLAGVFALTGPVLEHIYWTNLLLAAASTGLVMAIARHVRDEPLFVAIAGIGYALLIPAAFGVGLVQKENLSTPLLLLTVLAAINVWRGRRPYRWAGLGGLGFAASLLTGMASLPIGLLLLVAILRRPWREAIPAGVIVAMSMMLVLTPWLMHTQAQLGSPVITTNGGFNLYLGNNPAATGRFVSIADTPIGPQWQAMREELGEKGATDSLARLAIDYARDHPIETMRLGLVKLALFWEPNIPDAADGRGIVVLARWIEVIQFLLLLALSLFAMVRHRRTDPMLWWLVGTIAAYWLLHAAVYIIPRYRDPVMPLILIMAALPIASWWQSYRRSRGESTQ